MVLVLELERGKVGRLDSSKHLVQYNTKWGSEFPWLVPQCGARESYVDITYLYDNK